MTKYTYTFEGKTYQVTIEEVTPATSATTLEDGDGDSTQPKPKPKPKPAPKPRIPIIIVQY